MQFEPTSLPDVILIRPDVFPDARGYFFESWQEHKFCAAGLSARFVQDNQSHSTQHTLRGLHYQVVRPQGRLVRVVRGSVFDVAVDIRKSSSTFGRSVGVRLSEENHCMLWIPPGFAHGFLVLSTRADFLYRCTDFWAPAHERSLRWCDPELNIPWPLPRAVEPLLSAKDAAAPATLNVVARTHAELDISNASAVASCIQGHSIDVIINAAAYTAVDRAEDEPESAQRANADAPFVLAKAARDSHPRLLHISMDFVFDGAASVPYSPDANESAQRLWKNQEGR